ncbi:MAG: type II secretion system minor pseudopilin GspJ [Maricaulaceae bacterium]
MQNCRRISSTNRESGFTLVEMLVALFLFSVISVGTLGSFQSAVQAKEATAEAVARHETLALMRATLRSDLSQVILRENRDAFGGLDEVKFSGGFTSLLDFTRQGRVNPGGVLRRSDIQRVRYIIEDGSFIRRTLGHENPAPQDEPRDRILLDGVASAEVSFTRNNIDGAQFELGRDAVRLEIDYLTLTLRLTDGRELIQIFDVEAL